jgi:hypothetical protein
MYPERDRNRGIRYLIFILFICLGFAGGWYYARVLNPVDIIDTTPVALRSDYQTDFVLMVSEVYSVYQDPNYAICQIALLGGVDPIDTLFDAMQYGSTLGYSAEDLVLIGDLKLDLEEMQIDVEVCY